MIARGVISRAHGTSTAPAVHGEPRGFPSWSVVGHGEPRPRAGLAAPGTIVSIGPP